MATVFLNDVLEIRYFLTAHCQPFMYWKPNLNGEIPVFIFHVSQTSQPIETLSKNPVSIQLSCLILCGYLLATLNILPIVQYYLF